MSRNTDMDTFERNVAKLFVVGLSILGVVNLLYVSLLLFPMFAYTRTTCVHAGYAGADVTFQLERYCIDGVRVPVANLPEEPAQ